MAEAAVEETIVAGAQMVSAGPIVAVRSAAFGARNLPFIHFHPTAKSGPSAEGVIRELKRLFKIEKKLTHCYPRRRSPHGKRRILEEYGLVTDDYHRTQWVWFAVTFTAIWRNFSSANWRTAGEISKKSRTDVRA